jgi:enoyl-CoA hydratase/carnithine racemase
VSGLLSIEHRGEVALVTLQRPEKANALSIELRQQLGDALSALDRDEGVGCVVLTGAGSSFCSGMDTDEFGGDLEHRRRLVETSTLAFQAVGNCRRPVVAAVNGPALAGGFALALLCDLRVASDRARFGYPELPRGIPPSYAAARAVLPATVAQELCLTGRVVQAQEAQRLGIVREVVAGDVLPRGVALAERIAALPRRAILETKRRTMLERRHLWGFLFEEEERVFRRALLRDEDPDAAESAGKRRA